MTFFRLALFCGLLLAGAGLLGQIAPAKSKLRITRTEVHFPVVSGFNLNRQEFEFPRDFEADLNLVMIPFQQDHQQIVNTWIPMAQEIETTFPGFRYYELPTIYEMSTLSRTFLNEGMRAGIPDQKARERTITLYLNKQDFRSALEIPDEKDIHLFLVDQSGNILWRTSGAYTAEKASDLIAVVKELRQK